MIIEKSFDLCTLTHLKTNVALSSTVHLSNFHIIDLSCGSHVHTCLGGTFVGSGLENRMDGGMVACFYFQLYMAHEYTVLDIF